MDLKEQIDEFGYVLLPNLITEEECEFYKELLESDYEKYNSLYASNTTDSKHGLDNKSFEKVVYNLHNKHISWYKLFENPKVTQVLDSLLKEGSYNEAEPYYLYNNSARCPLKGNPGQQLHIDSRLPGINYCIVANVLWLLDDFTAENGATRVVPKSHKLKEFAADGVKYDDEILITGKRGSAIIFNANLWHGGGANINGASRWAVALGYSRWFFKPSFDYMFNTPEEIYNQLTDDQKKLFGFNCVSPKDEFTRVRTISKEPEVPFSYSLPKK